MRKDKRLISGYLGIWGILWVLLSGCSTPTPRPLTPITVQLLWMHSAQFAGLYAADRNGGYAAEGLTVTFIPGGPSVDVITPVVNGTAQFGLTSSDNLIPSRAAGHLVRAVAVIFRRDPIIFFALKSSNITRPQDFVGKKVLVRQAGRPRLLMMLSQVGIRPDQVALTDQGDYRALYSGAIDVAPGVIYNEVLLARNAGYEVNIISPEDYGVHFYADTLFTTDNFISTHPEVVTRFVRASLKGWTYIIDNPQAAGDLVAQYAPEADRAFEVAKFNALSPLVIADGDYIGWMTPEAWVAMAQTLREQGLLNGTFDPGSVYSLQFLNEVYKSRK